MTRISLLLSAALLLAAPTVMAQTYETGSQMTGDPQSSAQFGNYDGLGFPDYTPAQIAADVTTQYNPRTGAREFLAPTFDPFEEDEDIAATVSLRSTDGARDLNNDPLVDGALLDVSVFYTDRGDRRFGLTREGIFLNGEVVPTVLRDGRELECSARVTERVYSYDRYDDRYSSNHIYIQPRYRGHRGFAYGGRGFDYGRYGRGGRYGTSRPYPSPRRRPAPRPRPRPSPDRPTVTPDVDDSGQGRPRGRTDYYRNGRPAGTKPNTDRRPRPRRPRTGSGGIDLPTTIIRPDVREPSTPRVRPTPDTRRPGPVTRRPEPRPTPRPNPRPVPRPAPRVERPAVTPQPRPQPTPRPRPAPERRVAPVPNRNPSEQSRVRHEMFPGDGHSGAVVVSSQRDCAREDQLVLFIPNDRLEAARFDGLTLILREVTYDSRTGQTTVYDERPLYIPPNYIEGFRIATAGE